MAGHEFVIESSVINGEDIDIIADSKLSHKEGDKDRPLLSEEDAERLHWYDAMRTLLLYEDFMDLEIQRRKRHLQNIPKSLASKLPMLTFNKFAELEDCYIKNQEFLSSIVEFQVETNFSNQVGEYRGFPNKYMGDPIPYSQHHRNQAILHSVFREWSSGGAKERDLCFLPLMNQLKKYLPVTDSNRYLQRVLVPGCGAARLPLEIAGLGYACEANEFSSFMVMTSHFLLNAINQEKEFCIYPWIDRVCNVDSLQDIFQSYLIPDRAAMDILSGSQAAEEDHSSSASFPRFSFSAGDFLQLYGNKDNLGKWDAVVTCFFLDTAPVVLEYIELITNVLKPGGIWTNVGPLLYHWMTDEENNNDARFQQSIELSWDEIKMCIANFGLELLEEDWIDTTYGGDCKAMMQTHYHAKFFTARKPLSTK